MNTHEIQQHHFDEAVLQLIDACFTLNSVYDASHVFKTGQTPNLSQVLENAEWIWQYVVSDAVQVVHEDTGLTPTDIDDIRVHYLMLIRRRHVDAMKLVLATANLPDEPDEPDEDDDKALVGMYL